MTQRTQIYLDPEQHRRAKQRAAELGVSMAEYVRRVVARDLGQHDAGGDVTSILALGDSGGSDIASHKDEYIGTAMDTSSRPRVAR